MVNRYRDSFCRDHTGRFKLAEEYLQRAISIAEKVYGGSDERFLALKEQRADLLAKYDQSAEAQRLLEQLIAVKKAKSQADPSDELEVHQSHIEE